MRAGMPAPPPDGLQIEEDIDFQRRWWRVQRVGWVVIALMLLTALLGFLGSGPLSKGTALVPGIMRVEYQRFTRYQTPETLTVHLEAAAIAGPVVRIGIDRRYLDRSRLESVVPPPRRVHAAADRLIYEFDVAEPGRPLMIAFGLQPQRVGLGGGRVSLERSNPEAAAFRQVVHP